VALQLTIPIELKAAPFPDAPSLLFINESLANLNIWVQSSAILKDSSRITGLIRYGIYDRPLHHLWLIHHLDIRGYALSSLGTSPRTPVSPSYPTSPCPPSKCMIGISLGAHIALNALCSYLHLTSSLLVIALAYYHAPPCAPRPEGPGCNSL
jgi:hypothetical protein